MTFSKLQTSILLLLTFLLSSCKGKTQLPLLQPDEPIAEYIRHIFQDKNDNFWFGTNGYGVAHYNGDEIVYFSNNEGFHGTQITGIAEDIDKNIWFATDQGVVKYEWLSNKAGKPNFVNYSDPQYFGGSRFWSIYADSKGQIWAGAAEGIYRFEGEDWKPFKLPYPDAISGMFITKGTSWSIIEDNSGHIWISTNGFGVYKYDGQSFVQYTQEEGLTDNSVDVILEDSKSQIWFGTRFGGVSRFDGKTFTNYTQLNSGIENNEVCAIYEDTDGYIWLSAEGYGVYRFDGKTFSNYSGLEGLGVSAVQTIFQDKKGRIWVGGGGGLYRLSGNRFINVNRNGPWD